MIDALDRLDELYQIDIGELNFQLEEYEKENRALYELIRRIYELSVGPHYKSNITDIIRNSVKDHPEFNFYWLKDAPNT